MRIPGTRYPSIPVRRVRPASAIVRRAIAPRGTPSRRLGHAIADTAGAGGFSLLIGLAVGALAIGGDLTPIGVAAALAFGLILASVVRPDA